MYRERDFFIYQVTRKEKKKTGSLENRTSFHEKDHMFPNFPSVSSRDTDSTPYSSYMQKSGLSSAPRKCVVMITLCGIQISYILLLLAENTSAFVRLHSKLQCRLRNTIHSRLARSQQKDQKVIKVICHLTNWTV